MENKNTETDEARIDKWLWSVRLYKTRTLASDACKGGKVKYNGDNIKPAKSLKIGDTLTIQVEQLKKTILVKGFPKSRVGAKLVSDYMEDVTPQEELDKYAMIKEGFIHYDPKYKGRPTKKDRRNLDEIF